MIILHVTKKYPNALGGDSTCVFHLEKYKKHKGHKVFILTTNCPEITDEDNLYKFGCRGISSDWDRITLKRIVSLLFFIAKSLFVIRKTRPDIIYSHSADLGFIISLWAKLSKIKVINICHTVNFPYKFIGKIKRYPEWVALRFAFFDKIITVDAQSVKFFHSHGIRNCQHLDILGVDIDEFRQVKKHPYLMRHEYKKFIFVGRIDPLKGLNYLIEASQQLRNSVEDFEVWIIGDGPYKDQLKKMSVTLKMEKHIRFFKAITCRKRLVKMYRLADVFVLPSLMETFSLVVLEAWAAGLPVIATNQGVIARVGENQKNALIVPPKDAHSLYLAMLRLINDEALREKIASAGRIFVEEKFRWDIVLNNLENITFN